MALAVLGGPQRRLCTPFELASLPTPVGDADQRVPLGQLPAVLLLTSENIETKQFEYTQIDKLSDFSSVLQSNTEFIKSVSVNIPIFTQEQLDNLDDQSTKISDMYTYFGKILTADPPHGRCSTACAQGRT